MNLFKRGLVASCCVLVCAVGSVPAQAIPVPAGPNAVALYAPIESPLIDSNPANARPLALGSVATGGATLSVSVGAETYGGPVDAYLLLMAPELLGNQILLFTAGGGIQDLTAGIVPWKSGVTDISGPVLGDIPVSFLPPARYTFLLIVEPAGTPLSSFVSNFHFWGTTFSNIKVEQLGNAAVGALGQQAPVAILLAWDKGFSLLQIVDAILAGGLSASGDIAGQWPAMAPQGYLTKRASMTKAGTPWDETVTAAEYAYTLTIIALVKKGYDAEQITQGLVLVPAPGCFSSMSPTEALSQEDVGCLQGFYTQVTAEMGSSRLPAQEGVVDESVSPDGGGNGGGSGSWIDFDFTAASTVYYDIKLVNGGEVRSFSHAFNFDCCVQAAGDPLDSYALSLSGTSGSLTNFEGLTDSVVGVNVYDSGNRMGGTILRSYANAYGGHDAQLDFDLPFSNLTQVGGRPAVVYGASGASTCNFISLFAWDGNQGSFTGASCDEGSHVWIKLY